MQSVGSCSSFLRETHLIARDQRNQFLHFIIEGDSGWDSPRIFLLSVIITPSILLVISLPSELVRLTFFFV